MAVTQQDDLAGRMARLRSHGITRYPADMVHPPDGPWYYEQVELGFNYRMTDIHGALGLSQMSRIDEFVSARHKIADRYNALLAPLDIVRPWQHPDTWSALHLYVVRIPGNCRYGLHKAIFERLRASGVGVNLHYIPVYRQPYYEALGFRREEFPNSEAYYREAISLPIFPSLTEAQQDRVIDVLTQPSGYQNLF